jgi:hypothetical protein
VKAKLHPRALEGLKKSRLCRLLCGKAHRLSAEGASCGHRRPGVAKSPLTRPAPAEKRRQRTTLSRGRGLRNSTFNSLQLPSHSAQQTAEPLNGLALQDLDTTLRLKVGQSWCKRSLSAGLKARPSLATGNPVEKVQLTPSLKPQASSLKLVAVLLVAFCFLPSAFCSKTGGSGKARLCTGWMPAPCAPTDRVPRPQLGTYGANVDGTWSDSGPQVGVPFVNEFGEREVRATDGNIPGGSFIGDGWTGPVGWWFNYFSVYDTSIGGYYFFAPLDNGEGNRLFQLNGKTMQVTPVCSAWAQCNMPYAGEWSFVTPGLMYYSSSSQILAYDYDNSTGPTLVYDFANCPGLAGKTFYDLVASADDNTFSVRNTTILAVYSKRYGKCYWLNNAGGLIGGTDNPSPVAASLPWPGPVTLGALSATTGSIAPGTYYVEESVFTDGSSYETLPSAPVPVTVSTTGGIQIAAETNAANPIFQNVGKTCNIYAGTSATGPFYRQLSAQNCSNTLTVSSYTASGTQPVSVSSAGYGLHDGQINASGQFGWSVPDNGANFNLFWQIYNSAGVETNTTNMCSATSGNCLGHLSFGYNEAVYAESNPVNGGVPAHYDFGLVPLATPTTQVHVHLTGPPYYNPFSMPECNVTDTHTEWVNANAFDSMPFISSSFDDGANSPYSLMQIKCAWDHEIDATAVDGSGTTWRLAHNRASGLQNPDSSADSGYNALSMPVCSADGHYCLWATDWQSSLGTQTGEVTSSTFCGGAYGCQWHAGTSYLHYQEIIDSRGNEEMAAAAGTSGSSQPVWPTTIGGTVTDGSVTWQMGAGCNSAQTTSTQGTCRTDVFIVEIH